MHKAFVYGTLKAGYGNWNNILKGNSTFVGKAVTVDDFVMLNSGFPVVVEADDYVDAQGRQVAGEVYAFGDDVLKRLDRLEGEGIMYDRKEVRVQLANGSIEIVNMYIGCDHWIERDNEVWHHINAAGQWEWK